MKANLKVKLITHTPNPDLVVASAAKLCYSPVGVEAIQEKLTDEQIEKFVNMLVTIGHESPLEHVSFTFAVEGIDRATSHQIVRHRISSFSQQSQRYVNLEDSFEYVQPIIIDAMDSYYETNDYSEEFKKDMEFIHSIYNKWQPSIKHFVEEAKYPTYGMTPEKVANENARTFLPNGCETKMIFTMNGRSLLNFFKHRCCKRSQGLIRRLSMEMLDEVRCVAPVLFSHAGAGCLRGKCPEGKMTCGDPYAKKI